MGGSWYTQTSGWCTRQPCNCASPFLSYCSPGADTFSLLDPDEGFAKMLSYSNPRCPERFRGLWWLSDNQLNQEVVMTFEDADWVTDQLAQKASYENWTRAPSCCGSILACQNYRNKSKFRIEVSPDKKWCTIGRYTVYVPDPDEFISRPDGSDARNTPMDMVRADWIMREGAPQFTYVYMIRQVAYLDTSGNMVKTANYDKLQEWVRKGDEVITATCPQYFVNSDFQENVNRINPQVIIRWPSGGADA